MYLQHMVSYLQQFCTLFQYLRGDIVQFALELSVVVSHMSHEIHNENSLSTL